MTDDEFRANNAFAKMVRNYTATAESDANLPRRAPRLRDDDPNTAGSSDRETDAQFFDRKPSRQFRISSATGGDTGRAGLYPLPPGMRAVRLTMRNGVGLADRGDNRAPLAVIFRWPDSAEKTNALNKLSNDGLRGVFLDEIVLGGYLEADVSDFV